MRSYYVSGQWNAICDRCGFQYKSAELRLEWTGFRVCSSCFESRHPQDFLKVRSERGGVPWSRPEQSPISASPFLETEGVIAIDILTESGLNINTEQ
jgi:hypothetical protein